MYVTYAANASEPHHHDPAIPHLAETRQGNPGSLAAYRKGLAIGEALAARDPANARWQTDVAVSCAKLGTLDHGQSVEAHRAYLLRGREILAKHKAAGRLMANQDWTEWFEQQIGQLPPSQS